MKIGTLSRREYSKAYYKKRIREKVTFTYEKLTPSINQFLLDNKPEWYLEIYGVDVTDLYRIEQPYRLQKMTLGVIRSGDIIKAVFSLDGSGRMAGSLEGLPITLGIQRELERYNVVTLDESEDF
mgnify:FL=1